jgi:hypothetical protein
MRFMVMHKVDARMESGGPPDPEIIQKMGAHVQSSFKSGIATTGAGLHRSALRARVEAGGAVTRGPFAGRNELLSSFVMIRARTLDEAIERARQISRVLGDVDVEVGPVVEPWDLGVMAKPPGDTPGRFLLLCKGSADTESGKPPSPERRAELSKFIESLRTEGVLLLSDQLAPSSRGARLASGPSSKRSWVDGPFAESKELIAGFCVLELPARADAIAWADRYAAILGDNEVDVRELEG